MQQSAGASQLAGKRKCFTLNHDIVSLQPSRKGTMGWNEAHVTDVQVASKSKMGRTRRRKIGWEE
jgi:hypothetical protein